MAAAQTKLESGDRCPSCLDGSISVLNTVVIDGNRHRYLGCRACGYRPEENKRIVPIQYAPKRSRFK